MKEKKSAKESMHIILPKKNKTCDKNKYYEVNVILERQRGQTMGRSLRLYHEVKRVEKQYNTAKQANPCYLIALNGWGGK